MTIPNVDGIEASFWLAHSDTESFPEAVFDAIAKVQLPMLPMVGDIIGLEEFPMLHFRVARRDLTFPRQADAAMKLKITLHRQYVV